MAHRAPTGSHRRVRYNPSNPHHVYDPDKTRTDMPALPDEMPQPESHPDFYQEPDITITRLDSGKEVLLRTAIFVLCLLGAVAVVLIMQGV